MTCNTSEVAVCCSSELAQLVEQPRVLDGDHRLRGKIRDQRDLFVGKWLHFPAVDGYRANRRSILEHRDSDQCTDAGNIHR